MVRGAPTTQAAAPGLDAGIVVGEKSFTGGEDNAANMGKEAVAYYIARIKAFFDEEPDKWLQTVKPKGTKKTLGFGRDAGISAEPS